MKYQSGVTIPYGTHKLLIDRIPAGSTVLDIGCAQGYVDRVLKEEKNCTIYGLEYEEAAAKIAEQYCAKMTVGPAELFLDAKTAPYRGSTFDVILLADILEHLMDPWAVLAALEPYLKKGGIVIISLPNIANLWIRMRLLFGNFTYTTTGIMDVTHTKFFTRSTLVAMVRGAKLDPVSVTGVGQLNYLSVRFGALAGKFGHALTNLFPTLLSIQFIIVAKKRA